MELVKIEFFGGNSWRNFNTYAVFEVVIGFVIFAVAVADGDAEGFELFFLDCIGMT